MEISRRGFLLGAGAAFVALPVRSLLAAAKGNPQIRMGVLSDIHLNEVAMKAKDGDQNRYGAGRRGTYRAALEYFRDRGVNAVVIAGDMADKSRIYELMEVGRIWNEVFPDNKLPNGEHVEKVFVYGNHDVQAWRWGLKNKDKKAVAAARKKSVGGNLESSWQKAFGEEWKPVYHKTVNGYVFFCAHWGHEKELAAYIKEHADELKLGENRPFFCVQHPNLKGSLFTYWGDGGCDQGEMTEVLNKYPWAVSFSGHSHMALTDDRSIWQGGFTAMNTCTLLQIADPYAREWACVNSRIRTKKGDSKVRHMAPTSRYGRQGMVVDVFADHLEVDRREFTLGLEAGPLLTVPLPASASNSEGYSYEAQKARSAVPQFPVVAQAKVERIEGLNTGKQKVPQIVVSFPSATAAGDKGRVAIYRVEATDASGKEVGKWQVAQELHFNPLSRIPAAMKMVIGADEVPSEGEIAFKVTPIGFFRQEGKSIVGKLA